MTTPLEEVVPMVAPRLILFAVREIALAADTLRSSVRLAPVDVIDTEPSQLPQRKLLERQVSQLAITTSRPARQSVSLPLLQARLEPAVQPIRLWQPLLLPSPFR